MNLKLTRLYAFLSSTMVVTSLFFSTNVLSDMLIVKDDKLAKNLSIKDQEGKVIIDIEHSDIRGISHNYYESFNVGKKSVILKNAMATLIINEVTSDESSLLAGDLSVEGRLANIVIANPNGITCIDCSFSGVEKVILINGVSDGFNIGKYKVSNKGSVHFRTNKDPFLSIFNKINIISKDVQFHKDINFISNKLNIINGKQNYHLLNNIQSKFHKGSLVFHPGSTVSTNELNYVAGNNELINKGTLNVGDLTIEAKGKLINYGEIKLLSGRVYSFLKKGNVEYPIYDFLKRVSNFNVKSLSNEENARFIVYNTDVKFNLYKGNFTNKGYLSLEHSHLSTKSGNFYHNTKGTILNNLSSITIEADNKVRLNGIIDTRYSENSIFINKGKVINIKDINVKSVLVKN